VVVSRLVEGSRILFFSLRPPPYTEFVPLLWMASFRARHENSERNSEVGPRQVRRIGRRPLFSVLFPPAQRCGYPLIFFWISLPISNFGGDAQGPGLPFSQKFAPPNRLRDRSIASLPALLLRPP